MKYLKKYTPFFISENINIPIVPKTIKVELKYKTIYGHPIDTIIEDFGEGYQFFLKLNQWTESIRKNNSKDYKKIVCDLQNLKLWKLVLNTSTYQIELIRDQNPYGMPPLDPDIAQYSDLIGKIKAFLDSRMDGWIINQYGEKVKLDCKHTNLPTDLFTQEAEKFIQTIIQPDMQPGTPEDYDAKEKAKKNKLMVLINKMKALDWEMGIQEKMPRKWNEETTRKHPNYNKAQEMLSNSIRIIDFCDDIDPPPPPKNDIRLDWQKTYTSNKKDSESTGDTEQY